MAVASDGVTAGTRRGEAFLSTRTGKSPCPAAATGEIDVRPPVLGAVDGPF